jgi:predicted permease
MSNLVSEIRYAFRSLYKSRSYSAAFVVTLGLGIGVNAAIFSVINGVLLQPLPFQDADRMMFVQQPANRAGAFNAAFSFIEIDDYRAASRTIDEFVEFGDWDFSVIGRGDPHRVVGGLVTANYFEVLGILPQYGRTLLPSDNDVGAPPVMVLTHDYWTRMFGADPDIVGQTVKLTTKTVEVVGVLEPGSHYTGRRKPDVFTNYSTNDHYTGAAMRDARNHRMTDVFGRLAPGATFETAQAELTQINRRLQDEFREAYPERFGFEISARPWQEVLTESARPTFLIMMGTVLMVLLLACANVANLTLTRLIQRERELAVRSALGAGRKRIRRQLFTENLILALAGAGFGLLVAFSGLDLLVSYANRFTVRSEEIGLDAAVVAFTLIVGVGIAMLLAWAPSLPFTSEIGVSLNQSGGRNSGGISRRQLQRGLVVSQLALSFTLLIGAGLLVRSLLRLQRVDAGFEEGTVVTLQSPNFTSLTSEEQQTLFDGTVSRMLIYPGVQSAAYATWAPLQSIPPSELVIEVEGLSELQASTPMGLFNTVSQDYFRTVGATLLRGRSFGRDDIAEADSVVVINESLSSAYFGSEDPVGRRIRWQNARGNWQPWQRVVGVVANTRDAGIAQADIHVIYQATSQAVRRGGGIAGVTGGGGFPAQTMLVRTTGQTAPVVRQITDIVHETDPERPVDNVITLDELMREDIAPQRLNAMLFSTFAILALMVAAVGVLGVLAFSVTQRTKEFGVRLALGAEEGQVLRMVLGEGARLVLGALLLGGVASVLLSQFLSGLLFEIEPTDPVTFVAVGAVLALVALVAAFVPARRATRVDPIDALRAE